VNLRRGLYRQLIKNPNKALLKKYRKATYDARIIIKQRRSTNFNKLVDELNPITNPKNFWNVIKLFRNSEFFSSKNTYGTSRFDLVNEFIDNFSPFGMSNKFPECGVITHLFFIYNSMLKN